MEKNNKKMTMITERRIFQALFLVVSLIYLVKLLLNDEITAIPTLALVISIIFITVVFRTGFCGWICPLGTIFDYIRRIGRAIGNISFVKPINKSYKTLVSKNKSWLAKIDKYARYFKYVFLLWMMSAAFITDGDQHEGVNSLLIFLFFVVIGLFIDRSWCKYCCPLGATLGIVGKISPTKVVRDEDLCIDCNLCSNICAFNIDVANVKSVNDKDCNTCLECIDVCPIDGALNLKTSKFIISEYIYGFIIVFLLVIGIIIINLF